jgi:hypothetical protein
LGKTVLGGDRDVEIDLGIIDNLTCFGGVGDLGGVATLGGVGDLGGVSTLLGERDFLGGDFLEADFLWETQEKFLSNSIFLSLVVAVPLPLTFNCVRSLANSTTVNLE